MEKLEITSISSRGQVVIPQNLRKRLRIEIGEKFVVMGHGDTIILKKIEVHSFQGFEKLLKKTREFAKKKEIKKNDVDNAIKRIRKK